MESRDPNLVRKSCFDFKSRLAWPNQENVNIFAASVSRSKILEFAHSTEGLSTNRFDDEIRFTSPDEEAGFILIAHGLDFGSGFRNLLHKHRAGQGAWLTIRAGILKIGKEKSAMDADWLRSLTIEQVKDFFDCNVLDLAPLAKQLHQSIQEFGNQLGVLGFSTPGEFIATHKSKGAAGLVEVLVNAFPLTFRDEYILDDQQICFYKKAQLVVSEIYMRFAREDFSFKFADIDKLTAFVDNVVVAMMRMTNVVECEAALAARIESGEYIIKGSEEEVALRSAALIGVEWLVVALNEKVDELDVAERVNAQVVCNWLWGSVGKTGANRRFPRHLTPSTSYY